MYRRNKGRLLLSQTETIIQNRCTVLECGEMNSKKLKECIREKIRDYNLMENPSPNTEFNRGYRDGKITALNDVLRWMEDI